MNLVTTEFGNYRFVIFNVEIFMIFLATSYAYKRELCLKMDIIQDIKRCHPLFSLYEESVIQECCFLKRYPLVTSEEYFIILLYYSGGLFGVCPCFFPFQIEGFYMLILPLPSLFFPFLCGYVLFACHAAHCGNYSVLPNSCISISSVMKHFRFHITLFLISQNVS